MSELSSSEFINNHKPDDIFNAVIKVKDVSKVEKYNRTYINFLTSDGIDGVVYCKAICNLKTISQDHVALTQIKMDRNKGPKNMLNYDLVLTNNSKATVICRNEMKANVKVYPPTRTNFDDQRSENGDRYERKSNYASSVSSKRQNASKNPATYGTLLEDFEIIELEDEENKLVKYYKSVIRTDKGEEIPVAVNVKVKLPMILRKNYKISVFGGNVELDNVQGKIITNKNQIYFEGIEDDDLQKTQDSVSQQKQEICKEHKQQTFVNDKKEVKLDSEVEKTEESDNPPQEIYSISGNKKEEKLHTSALVNPITPDFGLMSTNKVVNSSMTCVHVENLHPEVNEIQLFNKFSTVGFVTSVFIHRDPNNGKSLGYAEINFQNHNSAQRAVNMEDKMMNGNPIVVKWSNRPLAYIQPTSQLPYDDYEWVNQKDKENVNLEESENLEDKKLDKDVPIYALSLDPGQLKPAGYVEEVLPPSQHIKLFLPFFIEEIQPGYVLQHPTFFGFNKTDAEMLEEILRIENEDKRCQTLFRILMYALEDVNIACAFAEWFLDYSQVTDDMKELFWLRSMDKEAFAVYEYHILGIGNEKSHKDNVDRIAGFLYLDEIIHYLLHLAGDSQYHQIGNEIEIIWNQKTQFARWKARNLLLLRLMHADSSKKCVKFWFNEFLVALDRHPKTRPIAAYLEPDYKFINEKYKIHLKTLCVPIRLEYDLVDESDIPNEPRPQVNFGSRLDFSECVIGDNYVLRNYQEELAAKAKKGTNTIICAPTGSGKTYVALDIIVNHLRLKRQYHQTGRVVLFAPTIPLVEQQHRRIQSKVGSEFLVTKMSGAEKTLTMDKKNIQAATVMVGDICVMTPQIFVNMLSTPLKKQKLYIVDFTLMVFDECHHCISNHPYNVIMDIVRKSKIKPQIVGLTASVGTGKARGIRSFDCEAIMEHIFGLCARMNATTVTSIRNPENLKELRNIVPAPTDEFIKMPPKIPDKFANTLALFMDNVQKDLYSILVTFANGELKKRIEPKFCLPLEEKSNSMNGNCKASPKFRNDLAILKNLVEKLGIHNKQDRSLCLKLISVLEKCYCVLKMNELFPARLALAFLEEEFSDFEEVHVTQNTTLSSLRLEILKSVTDDLNETLNKLEINARESENKPILMKLFEIIREQYVEEPKSRILIFVDLRKAAAQMCNYLGTSQTITSTFGRNRVGYITSSNQTAFKFGQSRDEQNTILKKFDNGEINILIATSVAEEGLDIASCNLVIKYNSVGSEKSFIQRKGRARAEFSRSILLTFEQYVEQTEFLNMQRSYYMNLCVEKLQDMRELEVVERINGIKIKMLKEEELKEAQKKNRLYDIYNVICMTCHKYICKTTEVRLLQPSHVIVCRRDCWQDTTIRRKKGGYNGAAGLFCGNWHCKCGQIIGEVIKYAEIFLPTLSKDGFRLENTKGELVEIQNKFRTWTMIMECFFYVPPVLSEDIRNMVGSLDEYDDIFKTATLCELDNLEEMMKIRPKSIVPKSQMI